MAGLMLSITGCSVTMKIDYTPVSSVTYPRLQGKSPTIFIEKFQLASRPQFKNDRYFYYSVRYHNWTAAYNSPIPDLVYNALVQELTKAGFNVTTDRQTSDYELSGYILSFESIGYSKFIGYIATISNTVAIRFKITNMKNDKILFLKEIVKKSTKKRGYEPTPHLENSIIEAYGQELLNVLFYNAMLEMLLNNSGDTKRVD